MRLRYRVLGPPTVALGAFLLAGCGPSNEENLGGQTAQVVPQKAGVPELKSYGDAMKYQAAQAAKDRPAAKGKATPPSQPKAASQPAKTEPEKAKSP
jgi:hypothetical protein